jgi:hypothetical protein
MRFSTLFVTRDQIGISFLGVTPDPTPSIAFSIAFFSLFAAFIAREKQ